MTESLLNLLGNAKSDEECAEILKAHESEVTQDDLMIISKNLKGNRELTEDELDCVTGGVCAFFRFIGNGIAGLATLFAGGVASIFSKEAGKKVINKGMDLTGSALKAGAKMGSDISNALGISKIIS